MKAFKFPLNQALQWREAKRDQQKANVAEAQAKVANLTRQLAIKQANKGESLKNLIQNPEATALATWPNYAKKTDQQIENLRNEAKEAQKAADVTIAALIEANQAVKLIQNLKQTARARWQRESDRELAIFADEASLVRLQSLKGRARSSAG